MANPWRIDGTYFEVCNCQSVCPCFFLSPPTTDECTALVAWHVDRGAFGDVTLDGINVVMAVRCPGHMAEVPWRVALYLDERAGKVQQDALTDIFTGRAGGHPATLVAFVGEVLGIRPAPIEYLVDGKRRLFRIPDVAVAQIETAVGRDGNPIVIGNHPLCIAGRPGTVARSTQVRYTDHGLVWEFSARHGFFSSFSYEGTA